MLRYFHLGQKKSDNTVIKPDNRKNPGEIMSKLPNFDVKKAPKCAQSAVSNLKTSFEDIRFEQFAFVQIR